MNAQCDGGGNRDMARWRAHEQPLSPFFDASVGKNGGGWIPCGVCSVELDGRAWAICPRRLLTFGSGSLSSVQRAIAERIVNLAGFTSGETVNVWSEITLRDNSAGVNYRLDYVLQGEDGRPCIVEVMTASTSGGNKAQGTDIQSAFCNAVLFAEGNRPNKGSSPGVNIRQVWARMASQLIVKSQIANAWDGLTVWVIQDQLANYMNTRTGLRLDELESPSWERGEVNVLSANINDASDLRLYSGPIHSKSGEPCWDELLDTPAIPGRAALDKKLKPESVIAQLKLR